MSERIDKQNEREISSQAVSLKTHANPLSGCSCASCELFRKYPPMPRKNNDTSGRRFDRQIGSSKDILFHQVGFERVLRSHPGLPGSVDHEGGLSSEGNAEDGFPSRTTVATDGRDSSVEPYLCTLAGTWPTTREGFHEINQQFLKEHEEAEREEALRVAQGFMNGAAMAFLLWAVLTSCIWGAIHLWGGR